MPRLSKTRTPSARRTSAPRRCPSRCARPHCGTIPAYADASILSRAVPGSGSAKSAIAAESVIQRNLWRLAGLSLDARPTGSAPRLYVESLNEMIDMQTTRVAAINNRVPAAISLVVVLGAAVALALMAVYLAMFSRGVITVLLAAGLLTLLLFVTFDLDRPARGFITVPTRRSSPCAPAWSYRLRPASPGSQPLRSNQCRKRHAQQLPRPTSSRPASRSTAAS